MNKLTSYAIALASTVAVLTGAWLTFASAADPTVYKSQPVTVAAPSVPFLTGWYVGAFVGYGQGTGTPQLDSIASGGETWTVPAGYGQGPDIRRDGMVLGGQIGYDWAMDQRWRVGLVGDLAFSQIGGTAGLPYSNAQLTSKMTWLGNADVRVAYLITPGAAIYVLGGLTAAGINNSIRGIGSPDFFVGPFYSPTSQSESSTKWGWNVGAGFEAALDNKRQWSVFVDGRYFKLPDSKQAVKGFFDCHRCEESAIANVSTKNEYSVFRVGFNYHPGN